MAETIQKFAQTIAKIIKSDRYVFAVTSGYMGEGKSCFSSQLSEEVAKITGTPFKYKDNMTYSRKELKEWIDGKKDGTGQKPEYSSILADELINMFFKRSWYDSEQIDGVQLLNKCRDRHLLVTGCVPTFWDLDAGIYAPTTFWIHIPERGRAWVFEKDSNPWAKDPWHRKYNEKVFISSKNPYKALGFVCEIFFDDWPADKKEEYYAVRNIKRVAQTRKTKKDQYPLLTLQRNRLLKLFIEANPDVDKKELAEEIQLSVRQIDHLIQNSYKLVET